MLKRLRRKNNKKLDLLFYIIPKVIKYLESYKPPGSLWRPDFRPAEIGNNRSPPTRGPRNFSESKTWAAPHCEGFLPIPHRSLRDW